VPRGVYKRTKEHKKIISKAMRKVWRERKNPEEKSEPVPEGRNKYDQFSRRIDNLSRDELMDALTDVREDILKRVEILSQHWNILIEKQKRRDKIEERLEELGMKFKD
jgi:hypothetical protein